MQAGRETIKMQPAYPVRIAPVATSKTRNEIPRDTVERGGVYVPEEQDQQDNLTNKITLRSGASGQLCSHALERGIGVGADRLDGGQAHDDNQRQHDGVFHRCGAIFRGQETFYLQSESLHCLLLRRGSPCKQPTRSDIGTET